MGHSRSYYLSNSDTSFCKLIIYCTEEVTFFYFTLLFLLYTIFYINNIYIYIYIFIILFYLPVSFSNTSFSVFFLSVLFPYLCRFLFFLPLLSSSFSHGQNPEEPEQELHQKEREKVWFGLVCFRCRLSNPAHSKVLVFSKLRFLFSFFPYIISVFAARYEISISQALFLSSFQHLAY